MDTPERRRKIEPAIFVLALVYYVAMMVFAAFALLPGHRLFG